MWKKKITEDQTDLRNYATDDFKALLRYVNYLASHKMGYPVSLLTYLGIINNTVLGIRQGSLANILLNNVGDPFKDSETSLLEVKKHEREILQMLEHFYGLKENEVRGYVTTGGTEGNFAGLWWSKRYLVNMSLDKIIVYDNLIKIQTKEEQELTLALNKIPLNNYQARAENFQKVLNLKNSIQENKNKLQEVLTPTVFYTKNHTHYSVPKIAEILHLNIRPIASLPDGSMDLINLRKELILNLSAHPDSSIIVIANIGTTVTGAIDNAPGIKKILDEIPQKPIYTMHLDGALTGFVLPILKPYGEINNYFEAIGANTIAISAHKYPGLSQPCGVILARREFYEKAFEKTERNVEYVGNIVDSTITGSRSGLNVLMLYNALVTLGLKEGKKRLTELVNENINNAKYLYEQLVKIYGPENVNYPYHFNVIFPRPSQALAKKYQLMLTGDRATICVLSNVTKTLINDFISDLLKEKEEVMVKTTITTDYTIVTLQDEHVKSAIDLFTKVFCDTEPLTHHLNIHYQDYYPLAKEVVQKAVKEGMSKVALDKNNKVIGLCIAEDLADPFIPHDAHYPKVRPVFELLEELSKPFLKGRKFIKGKVVHVWIAAIDEAYRGLGLSTQVDMAAIESAARKGFNFAYAEFTNELSENVTHQFKVLQLYNRIYYDQFISKEGTRPFEGIKGAAASYIATIRPGVKLNDIDNTYKIEEPTSH